MRDVNIDVPDQIQDEDTSPPYNPDYEEGRGDYLYHLRKDDEMED